jgi:signal transduction histidine kinase
MKRIPAQASDSNVAKDGAHLIKLTHDLARRALDLAASNHKLHEGMARGIDDVEHLRAGGDQSTQLLEESRHLQRHLQHLTRRILSSGEVERKQMSTKLQDEIAQTLLGIHVRLLALGRNLSGSTDDFAKEIASTQRLVEESVKAINRCAQEFGIAHEN